MSDGDGFRSSHDPRVVRHGLEDGPVQCDICPRACRLCEETEARRTKHEPSRISGVERLAPPRTKDERDQKELERAYLEDRQNYVAPALAELEWLLGDVEPHRLLTVGTDQQALDDQWRRWEGLRLRTILIVAGILVLLGFVFTFR